MSIASEKGKKLTPVGYRKAKIPSKNTVFKVPTGRTLFSGWRLGRNGETRFKITRKTVFSSSSCQKRNLFGHFQQIWAPAVPKNLVSVAGNVQRIRKKRKKITPKSCRWARIPSKTPVFRVPTDRTLFSGWRLGGNGKERQKSLRKRSFRQVPDENRTFLVIFN